MPPNPEAEELTYLLTLISRLKDWAPIHVSIEDTVYTGHEVLMEVDDNSFLIVGYPLWILGQQLRPHL